jgi:hypothetical protein
MPRTRDSVVIRIPRPGNATLAGLAAAAAAACLLVPAVAVAATSSSTPAVIQACYAKSGGALRVATTKCTSAQKSISWNSVGPRGPAGPQGKTGPQGPAGTFGSVTVRDVPGSVTPDTQIALEAICPSGDVAISGGASFGPGNGTGLGNVWIESSRPDPVSGTPTGWFVIINNTTSQTASDDDYVVCASK